MNYSSNDSKKTDFIGFNCPKELKKSIQEYLEYCKKCKEEGLELEAINFKDMTEYILFSLYFTNFLLRGGITSEKVRNLFYFMV